MHGSGPGRGDLSVLSHTTAGSWCRRYGQPTISNSSNILSLSTADSSLHGLYSISASGCIQQHRLQHSGVGVNLRLVPGTVARVRSVTY